ncbi:hypothetical protein GCM10007052_16720 [Halioglobus japonicus]|nr:hypothetical protein GCM10007052_16720 [Halioglobus japonicus]
MLENDHILFRGRWELIAAQPIPAMGMWGIGTNVAYSCGYTSQRTRLTRVCLRFFVSGKSAGRWLHFDPLG